MMTKIEQIWNELENTKQANPFVMRGYGLEGHSQIYVTWNTVEKERGLAVYLNTQYLPSFRRENELRDVAVINHIPPGQDTHFYLIVELKNQDHKDIFTSLAEDLIRSVASIKEESQLAKALLNRLLQWEALFSKLSNQGLTPQAQRGLYGELCFLRFLLESETSFAEAVDSWTGPFAAIQDFQKGTKAVEVKASAGNNHQKIQISSNRQLDETGLESLYLFHISLDIRPNNENTLNALVDLIEKILAVDVSALYSFQKKLEAGGYLKMQASFYDATGYLVRAQNAYRIEGDFPRIKEQDTPEGVGDVKYSILASQCAPWTVILGDVIADFKSEL